MYGTGTCFYSLKAVTKLAQFTDSVKREMKKCFEYLPSSMDEKFVSREVQEVLVLFTELFDLFSISLRSLNGS